MRTRSQTKKQKLDNENRKIPQLNEDVLGIILKHVVEKQQFYVHKTYDTMDGYWIGKYWAKTGQTFDIENLPEKPSVEEINWPDYLDSNSRRIVYHTDVKMFPDCSLVVPDWFLLKNHFKTKRDLDMLWKLAKNFHSIRYWNMSTDGYHDAATFLRRFWQKHQTSSKLVKILEKRLT